MEMISATNLTKVFNGIVAVDHLNLSIEQGALFGLLGPDGAGKSTTLKLLSGQLIPTSGSGWVAGFESSQEPDKVKAVVRHMSQGFDLYPDLSIQENLAFFADILSIPKSQQTERIDELLAFTHLTPFRARQAWRLSGGMKQKLALAVAILGAPQVLFLDEPTSGVDPVSRRDFWVALHQLRQRGVTLMITTAYMDEAERCITVGLMNQGKLLMVGTPKELKSQYPATLLSVCCERPRPAAKLLKEGLTDCHVDLFGDRVHVSCKEANGLGDRIRTVLQQHDMPYHDIQPIAPSLEDLFISLLSQAEDAHAPSTV